MNTNGGFLITQIKQIQGRVFEKLLLQAGIEEFNGAQGRILFVLWQEESIPITKLSQKTGLAKNTLTAMLDRLEKNGFILRKFDTLDRRQIRILLTEKARALQEHYDLVSTKMSEIFYRGLTNTEIQDFEHTLCTILKNLQAYEERMKSVNEQ